MHSLDFSKCFLGIDSETDDLGLMDFDSAANHKPMSIESIKQYLEDPNDHYIDSTLQSRGKATDFQNNF